MFKVLCVRWGPHCAPSKRMGTFFFCADMSNLRFRCHITMWQQSVVTMATSHIPNGSAISAAQTRENIAAAKNRVQEGSAAANRDVKKGDDRAE